MSKAFVPGCKTYQRSGCLLRWQSNRRSRTMAADLPRRWAPTRCPGSRRPWCPKEGWRTKRARELKRGRALPKPQVVSL